MTTSTRLVTSSVQHMMTSKRLLMTSSGEWRPLPRWIVSSTSLTWRPLQITFSAFKNPSSASLNDVLPLLNDVVPLAKWHPLLGLRRRLPSRQWWPPSLLRRHFLLLMTSFAAFFPICFVKLSPCRLQPKHVRPSSSSFCYITDALVRPE